MENEIKLAHYGRNYLTTAVFLSYIKALLRINVCLNKYNRCFKDIYIDETKNIIATINNCVDVYSDTDLLMYYIEDEYKPVVENIMLGKDI